MEEPLSTDHSRATICALGGGVLTWSLCVFGSPGTVGWFDAPELAAAGQQLGVAHAPGEPAYLLLVRLAQLIPLGDLASRAVWLAAACAAGLVAAVVWLTREIVPDLPTLSLAFVAVACSFCAPLWIQGIVVELYGLQALVTVTALLALCVSRGGVHGCAAAGLLVGLGAALNPLLTVLALPGLVLLTLARHGRPSIVGIATATVAAGAVAASCYLYLPLRSAADPGVCFAVIDRPSTMLDFVTGKPYARSFGSPGLAGFAANAVLHLRLMIAWCGLPVILLTVLGAVVQARTALWTTAGLVLFGVASWLSTITRPEIETFTPDVAGYFLVSCLVAVVLAAAAVGWLQRKNSAIALATVFLAVLWTAVAGTTQIRAHQGQGGTSAALALLQATPPGGILLLGSDSTALPVLYAITAGRRRPDLFAAPIYLLQEDQLARQLTRHPRLSVDGVEGTHEWLGRGLMEDNRELGVVGTPLVWPPETLDDLRPCGLGLALRRAGETPRDAERRDAALRSRLIEPMWAAGELGHDRQLRRMLSSTASMHAAVHLRRGERPRALDVLSRASAVHPDPWAMVHLQRANLESGVLAPPVARSGAAAAGRAALAAGDTLRASRLLRTAVDEYPDDADLWEDLASAQYWERSFRDASASWDAALRRRPGSPSALAGKERLYAMGIP